MKALIIANGPLPPKAIIHKLYASSNIVVCADGGANHARTLHIAPDVILGDMDSITASTKKYFSRGILKNTSRAHLTHPVVPLFPREGRINSPRTSRSLGKRRGR